MLITGAAGFIGNAACQRYRDEFDIVAIDDLSRGKAVPEGVHFIHGDAYVAASQFQRFDVVVHLAAQVSVVRSLDDPRSDFRHNAEVTMKLAHWASKMPKPPIFIYASTNKVYGPLPGVLSPITDEQPLAPSTPYGISKATGGLYVRDFLPETGFDFRQSCIYGEAQIGSEDQGWIGWLRKCIREGISITCYGDGSQVRDLLHVSDLLHAYDKAIKGTLPAGSYTVGGGMENSLSFAGAVSLLGDRIANWAPWRKDDQRYFVAASDGLRAHGWWPFLDAREMLRAYQYTSKVGREPLD